MQRAMATPRGMNTPQPRSSSHRCACRQGVCARATTQGLFAGPCVLQAALHSQAKRRCCAAASCFVATDLHRMQRHCCDFELTATSELMGSLEVSVSEIAPVARLSVPLPYCPCCLQRATRIRGQQGLRDCASRHESRVAMVAGASRRLRVQRLPQPGWPHTCPRPTHLMPPSL